MTLPLFFFFFGSFFFGGIKVYLYWLINEIFFLPNMSPGFNWTVYISISVLFGLWTLILVFLRYWVLHFQGVKFFSFSFMFVYVLSHSAVSNSLQPIDCSLPGSSIHRIFQAKILKRAAISCSRGLSWPRDGNYLSSVSYIGRCANLGIP